MQNHWDYEVRAVRASAVLTGSYVAGTVITTGDRFNQLIILWSFTKGSLTSGELKVESSLDGTTYYQETFSSISGVTVTISLGEHTQTATGNYRIALPIGPGEKHIKISVKGTGTVTSSLAAVTAILARS